jgi:hypothetical protein
MDWNKIKTQLHASLTDFIWDQWVSLGMAGNASGRVVPFVIDPEALLLGSLGFSMGEARLRDEVLDWLRENGDLLSVQRVKNLNMSIPVAPYVDVSGIAAFMSSQGYGSWKSIVSDDTTNKATDFTRFTLRGMSQAPDPLRPEAFILRMRQLFGVNSRVEILTWLLTHPEGHAAYIARDSAWFPKSVQAILNDLESAALVNSHIDGKRKTYTLSHRAGVWHSEFGKGLHWLNQGAFYQGIDRVIQTLESASDPKLSISSRAIVIRQNMIGTAFRMANLDWLFSSARDERGEALVDVFYAGCVNLIDLLEKRVRFTGL